MIPIKKTGLALAAAASAILLAPEPSQAQRQADMMFRIPYADGTRVRVTRDHLNHISGGVLRTRIDMAGRGGGAFRIVAAADGIVRMIEDSFSDRQDSSTATTCNNNYVWIDHGNGIWTKYSHMVRRSTTGNWTNQAGLTTGDFVKAGQFLGIESDVGCAGGDHLHFEAAEVASTGDITIAGGFLRDPTANLVPVFCGIPGGIMENGKENLATGFGIPVYTDRAYAGNVQHFTGRYKNHPDLHKYGFGDNISSMMSACPQKLYAVFYEHKNYGGRAFYYRGGQIRDLKWVGFNDNISSVKIFYQPRTGITVYQDRKFLGKSTFTTKSIADLGKLGLNDVLSSIRIHGNVRAILFEHKNFKGKQRTVTYDRESIAGLGIEDKVSSIKLIAEPVTASKAKLSFSVKPRNACPKQITITTEIRTDRAGPVTYRRERQGGPASGWITLTSKWDGSRFVAKKVEKQWVGRVDQVRRIRVKNGPVSDWVRFKVICPPFKVKQVDLKVEVAPGNHCPREITIRETYIANGPGTFLRRRERNGGPPSEWQKTEMKVDGGVYRITFTSKQKVGEVNQIRRVVARSIHGKNRPLRYFKIASKWRKFRVRCLKIEAAKIIFDGKSVGTCKFMSKVKLRVNSNMSGKAPYRLDCTDGQSRRGVFDIRRTGSKTYIGVATKRLFVRKSGKQICALKVDTGAGYKPVTLQGKDFTCKEVLDAAIYIDGRSRGVCPAKLRVRVRVNGYNRKAVPFNLRCSTGENWNGKIQVRKTGRKTFIGITKRFLRVKKSGKIVCALRSSLTGHSKVIALRGKDYRCVSRVGSGPSGKVTNPPSTSRLVCLGGRVRGRRCLCPRGAKLRKLRANRYRCACPRGTRVIRGICVKPAG